MSGFGEAIGAGIIVEGLQTYYGRGRQWIKNYVSIGETMPRLWMLVNKLHNIYYFYPLSDLRS